MPPQKQRRTGRHNWPLLRQEYVEGILNADGKLSWPSLDDLGDRHGVSKRLIRDHSADEGWVEARALFQRRVEALRQEERSTQLAEMGADLDISALRIARNGLAITAARLNEFGAMATRRAHALAALDAASQSGAIPAGPLPPAPDSEEVGRLARAAAEWYTLGTKALGDTQQFGVTLGTAPGQPLVVRAETDEERDARTEGIITILANAGVIPANGHDARGTRLALAPAPNGAGQSGNGAHAEDDAVHSDDADDG